jgi:REP element-mobilizing transposase RayT
MRKLRPPVPGIFHVATRTVDKRALFVNDYGRVYLLDLVTRVVDRFEWVCWSYVLMGTHYHLIVDTPNANLSLGMQFLNGTYAQRYNKLLGRYGHVFSARFCSREIADDDDLKAALRYVARNPVVAGICRDAGDWFWSSYGAVVGSMQAPGFLDVRRTLALFDDDEVRARAAFSRFVAAKDTDVDVKAGTYPALFEAGV